MKKTDVVIVGTGAAGLFCALQLPEKLRVLMITKDSSENSNSFLAQGGISALRGPDDYETYFEDTIKAGHYKNNRESVAIMIQSSPEIIEDLIGYGVEFEHDEHGLAYTREGAHSVYRILYHEDITGKEITGKLLAQVKKRKNITIYEKTPLLDIISEDGVCKGVIAQNPQGELLIIQAQAVILATGGLGGLFKDTTNFPHITGDALAIAIKHGIELQDINYIQIHPTALYSQKSGRRFLISESVRGEGAVLLNANKERFVDELLPRDLLTKAIQKQMALDHKDYVYLCLTHMDPKVIQNRFPNIYHYCLEEGYDLTKDCIPVAPVQHYFMGGIKVDINSKTTMDNLYAVGETSCNGVHGANRLASNSLLESLVFAKRAAAQIDQELPKEVAIERPVDLTPYHDTKALREEYKNLVLDEIRRSDHEFYAQWFNNKS
ncbi:MAG: L-aspartate oxidase [Bacillota bacterium]|jgi:L-aspartate oxidase